MSIETIGTAGNDSLQWPGMGAGIDDIMDGGPGDDTMQAGAGDDTYYFSKGNDLIYESGGVDTIAFRDGVMPGQVSIYRDGSSYSSASLVIEDGLGSKTTVSNHFSNANYSVEYVTFTDSTAWNLSSIEIETRGTSGNDNIFEVLLGDASSNDTIYGYAGNDQIQAGEGDDWIDGGDGDDVLMGWNGNDTYVYTSGLDAVTETSGQATAGMDTLIIAGGRTINDIAVSDYSNWDTKVIINSGTDEVTLMYFRQGPLYQVETVKFDDGFETDLTTYASWLNGTSGNDMVAGNGNDNTMVGFAGNDSMTGGAGHDDMHGGAGADTLEGQDGDDLLYGGDGDDTLYGGAGTDTMHGGAGADIFMFETASAFSNVDTIRDFSVIDDDVLDLTDILDTVYDPLNDAIADFVQFTESSGSTFVEVDRDGTGSTYSFAQIVKLENVTGLSSPELLETNGNLLAA
jgi:Ca2+-binding RTX toxin-like protein